MKIDNGNKLSIFDNDDEFISFALNPSPNIHTDQNGCKWFDYDYTDDYRNMINNGYRFYISCPNSSVCKRNGISVHTVFKPVSNLVDHDQLIFEGIEI